MVWTILAMLFVSCDAGGEPDAVSEAWWKREKNRFASGFTMGHYRDIKVIEVHKPWQGAAHHEFTYILVPEEYKVHDSLYQFGQVIRIPVERVICTSTTHIAFLEALGQTSTIVAVSGGNLVSKPAIRDRIENRSIKDIGYDRNLNFETLIASKPNMVFTYGIENEIAGFVNRLEQVGIPVVLNGEYLEEHPLGKLEWIKFMGAFYNMEERAISWFDSISRQYHSLVDLTADIRERPVVMTGLPWKDIWYISGDNSTIAQWIKDAGGTYLWDGLQSDKAVPMDIETVFERSARAEIWINSGNAASISDILKSDNRFAHFKPIQLHRVFNNNARMNKSGGNDFWESGIIYPDRILEDLIFIFHPHLIEGHTLYYYTRLQ